MHPDTLAARERGQRRVAEFVRLIHPTDWVRGPWTYQLERAPWDKTSERGSHAVAFALRVTDGDRLIFRDIIQCWGGPPVMVPDGTFDSEGNSNFRRDPIKAARIDLAHTVKVVTKDGKEPWVKGKPGTVSTFYADSSDGEILSHDNFADDYASARAGSAFFSVDNTGTAIKVGQRYNAGLTWYLLYEGFVGFDTSGIPDSDEITDAHVSLYINADATSPDFTVVMYANDWGASLTSGDWVAGASLSGLTVVGSYPTSGFAVNSYHDLGGSGLAEEINPTGFTRVLIASSRLRDGNAPSGDEYFEFRASEQTGTTQDPKLVVTHAAATKPFRRTLLGVGV